MLGEYHKMMLPIPTAVAPMLRPFTDRVDEAIQPGIVSLTWTSIKIPECKLLLCLIEKLYFILQLFSNDLVLNVIACSYLIFFY